MVLSIVGTSLEVVSDTELWIRGLGSLSGRGKRTTWYRRLLGVLSQEGFLFS